MQGPSRPADSEKGKACFLTKTSLLSYLLAEKSGVVMELLDSPANLYGEASVSGKRAGRSRDRKEEEQRENRIRYERPPYIHKGLIDGAVL